MAINDFPLDRNSNEILRIMDRWQHLIQFGEVCPVNWAKGNRAMQTTSESLSNYLTLNIEL